MKDVKESCEALNRAARDAATSLAFAASAVELFGRRIYAGLWHDYIMAGAPYGETRKGLMRWLSERPI